MSYRKTGFIVDVDDARYYSETGKKVVAEFYWLKGPKHGEFPSYKFISGAQALVATLRHEESVEWTVSIRGDEVEIEAVSEGEALARATELLLQAAGLVSE